MSDTPNSRNDSGPRDSLPKAMSLQNTGTVIGGYLLTTLEGSGGFGALYRVTRENDSDAVYALKLSKKAIREYDPADRPEVAQRARRESAALAMLNHPNVIKVRAFGTWPTDDGYPYLVTDYVEGYHLAAWRQYMRPSVMKMCAVLAKLADAIDYVHRSGIFHRDVKSENALVRSEDSEPLLLDFGISKGKHADKVTRVGFTLGTRSHFSPEYCDWIRSAAFADGEEFQWSAATDLHAFGVMAYELFTGATPWNGVRTERDLEEQIRRVVPQLPSLRCTSLPGAIDSIVMRLLAKNPRDRFASGGELAAALRRAMEDGRGADDWERPLDISTGPAGERPTGRAKRAAPSTNAALGSRLEVERAMAAARAAEERPAVPASPPDPVVSAVSRVVRPSSGPAVGPVGFVRPSTAESRESFQGPPPEEAAYPTEEVPLADEPLPTAAPSQATARAAPTAVPAPTPAAASTPAAAPAGALAPPRASRAEETSAEAPGSSDGGGPPGFRAPTHAGEQNGRWTGVAPPNATHRAKPDDPPAPPKYVDTQMREQLSKAGAGRRPNWILISALGALLAVLVFFWIASRSEGPRQERRSDLLAEAEKHRREEEARAALRPKTEDVAREVSPLAPPPPTVPVAVAGAPDLPAQLAANGASQRPAGMAGPEAGRPSDFPPSLGVSGVPAPPPVRRGRGERRPAGGAAVPEPAPVATGPFQRSRALVASASPAPKKGIGVPIGSHIPVKLLSPLDSRTLAGAPVEAVAMIPFLVDGAVVIPARTVFFGVGAANGGRFTVHFSKARLPDNTEAEVEGVAMDRGDAKAGLVASRRIEVTSPTGPGLGEKVARSTAGTAVGALAGGGLAGSMAQTAASQVISHSGDDGGSGSGQSAIMLDAPTNFTIFATRSF